MSKQIETINGHDFAKMFLAGTYELKSNITMINNLNVFPVPDGDTGTNMHLTLMSGVDELLKKPSAHMGEVANTIARGLLLGARGNSGVILSQLFRGFAKSIAEHEQIHATQFIEAFHHGVQSAYKAVMKPVEGTILTVSREAAEHISTCKHLDNIVDIMQQVIQSAEVSLSRTPELLPILKQVGVVDAGGQGLVFIYQGFLAGLVDENHTLEDFIHLEPSSIPTNPVMHISNPSPMPAQIHLHSDDIEFGYCTEFMLNLDNTNRQAYHEDTFREQLLAFGDSLVVVTDEEWVKVHIHAEYPGEVMNLAMNYGSLSRIKIENMRDQHSKIMEDAQVVAQKKYGFISVASGSGIYEIFKSLGVDHIVSGGQSMNPSIEEILTAIQHIHAEHIFILPNNSNIILAAQQARDLTLDKSVYVIPTKTIPQGITAMIAYRDDRDASANLSSMSKSIELVKSGQITVAVRDSHIDGIEIKKGSFIGIKDGKIVASENDMHEAGQKLVNFMVESCDSVITLLTGEGADSKITDQLVNFIQQTFPNLEVEIRDGGQAVYPYLVAVE